jgi:hypothetical protein
MNDRPNDLLRIRPEIKKTKQFDSMSSEERFQNETLRPILKLQNPLLVAFFQSYIEERKGVFYDLDIPKKLDYIESALTKDQKLRNSVKGIILGQFTVKEYIEYNTNASAFNKRIMSMLIERLKDQVESFEKEFLVAAVAV